MLNPVLDVGPVVALSLSLSLSSGHKNPLKRVLRALLRRQRRPVQRISSLMWTGSLFHFVEAAQIVL